ncbi:MAG: hypothetical protein SOY96_00245 [Lachnospiraceae bacterium]|nr:hypothetical protein [Lachnospiraceae bacterium]
MKKGLAIVLAAATALTFAPVSTLGLQGVVEAQAAVDDLANWTTAGTADYNGAAQTRTVDSTSENLTFKLNVKNDGADAFTAVNVKNLPTGVTATTTAVSNLAASKSGDINFAVTANTVSQASKAVTVETVVTKTVDSKPVTTKHTYTFNLAIVSAYKDAEGKISGVDSNVYIQRSKASSVTITPSYVTENGKENNAANYKFTVVDETHRLRDLSEANSVPVDDVTGDAGKVNVESAATGSVKLTVDKATELDTTKTISAYLVAYKLNSATGKYTPVAYNPVTINPYAVSADLVLSDKYNNGVSVLLNKTTPDSILANAEVYDAKTGTKVAGATLTHASASIAFPNEAIASLAGGVLTGTKLGSETATITVPYTTAGGVQGVATKQLRVNVISDSSSVIKVTADGSKDAANLGTADAPIRLNVKSNKTFDLSKYVYVSDPANTTIAYKSDNNKNTVSDAGVVNATAAVDQFIVTVQAKDKKTGIVLASTDVYFRVNALPDDVLAVSGGSIAVGATVLSDTDYKYTSTNMPIASTTEETLAASQIHYVQLDVTGNETSAIQKDLKVTSANGAKLEYTLITKGTGSAFKAISQAGVLTIAKQPTTPEVAVIKVVSSATANSEVTTSYFYVVLDKADPNVDSMFEAAYKLGTDAGATKLKGYQSDIVFSKDGYTVTSKYLKKSDDKTAAQNLYNLDSVESFRQTLSNTLAINGVVGIANAEGKTEHVLVSVTNGYGTAYKVITITSVPGVRNSVTKIEDATNNKTVYTPDMGTAIPELILDGNTTLKVTIKYSIDKNGTTSDINSTSLYGNTASDAIDPLNQNIITRAKENVKKGDTYNTFYLYPTSQGTQKVTVHPSGNISSSDHSITYNDDVTLALTYRANTKPSKVTGLKVANKKGAKVSVSFDAASNHNMKYWVQKKIGKKVAGKSVASNKATLSVKKGATVKVRVKAYYYDNEGNKHVGAYSSWKTLKTDKK